MRPQPCGLLVVAVALVVLGGPAGFVDAQETAGTGQRGKTLYVSKLGDNSDGGAWAKAFHTIQAALLAVPDDRGGHRIVVRPDTYVEANLYTNQKGAKGAYNTLVGDVDGRLGSGATGWVVIDSSCPGVAVRTDTAQPGDNPPFKIIKSDLPESGFKSVDWWGTFRSNPKFSSICWDRWTLRNLYATGGDAGLFWDLTDKSGQEFTVVVEDCVGIGRAFGRGLSYPVVRKHEPSVFRRCYLASLDWWGDAGGLAVGAYNTSPPQDPDVVCEDCTLVGPDNAVQITFPSKYIRLKMTRCRLISLNFSQPQGKPSTGNIASITTDPKQVHIDFEDCDFMGYKVFGASDKRANGRFSYTTKGRVRAYVQYQQSVPDGFERLGLWPCELFASIAPPSPNAGQTAAGGQEKKLVKQPEKLGHNMETTPVWFQGRLLSVQSHRQDLPTPNLDAMCLQIIDAATGKEISRFGRRHSFASAIVEGDTLHVFAAEHGEKVADWFGDVYHFTSTDLKTWRRELALARGPDEPHLLNTSVCRDEQGYVMAYESDAPVKFCFKFARSNDLSHWKKVDGLAFAGVAGKEYSACPVVRYFKPYYYVVYLHEAPRGREAWMSFVARSKDLATWQLSPQNPILEAGEGEGCNNSDVDLIEIDGQTIVYYAAGNQADWCDLRRAVYPGPMREFFESYFPDAGPPAATVSAVLRPDRSFRGEFHVAPGGSDANPGTKDRPFATLVRARDAVRAVKGEYKYPIDVVLHQGTYFLDSPLRLGPEDSGTATCPIVYRAAPGEKPVISGGRSITGWRRGPGELWTAEIPEVRRGNWYFRQLFVDGQRRGRARLPAQGQYPVKGKAEPHLRAFKFAPGQIDLNWRNLDDVEIVLPQFWAESRLRIESIDQAAGVVRFTGNSFRTLDWTDGWYAENVFEGLKEPGQWYLDRKTGVLYYWPLPDEKNNMDKLEFIAPVAQQWLRLEGDYKTGRLVEHVVFRGLTFQYSNWDLDKKLGYSYFQNSIETTPGQKITPGWQRPQDPEDERLSEPQSHVPVPSAIYAKGARHVRFEDNEIAHTGAWAIHLAPGGCKDNYVVGNKMSDLGAGAVRVGGPDPTNDDEEETGRSVITDNRIHDCGMVYFGAPAVFVGQSSGNLVAHNEISGWCEWAVTLGWSWGYFPIQNARDNVVEYNYVHDYGGSPLANHSAMYAMGVQPGTVFRHNLICNNRSPRSNGIILDAGAAAMRVEYNVVHNVQGCALVCNFNNFGHVIQNNIFALCGLAMTRSGDPGPLDSTGAAYRNIFYYRSDKGQRLFEPDHWSNYDMLLDYNLYYDASGKPPKFLGMNFAQWKAASAEHWMKMEKGYGLDCKSLVADPLFVDPRHGDFRLKPDSPAFKLGFRQIDFNVVGIRPRPAVESHEPCQ